MPNWVKTKVHFAGDKESLDSIKALMKTDQNEFDFNSVIPAAPELYEVSAGSEERIATMFAKMRRDDPDWKRSYKFRKTINEYTDSWIASQHTWDEWADLGDKYLYNKEHFGYTTWYDWCIENWGTKWNACDVIWYGNDYVVFDTAWSFAEPVFRKLAILYPDVRIDVSFADEDLGSNCGTFEAYQNRIHVDYNNDFDFACGVWDYDPDEIRRERYEDEDAE